MAIPPLPEVIAALEAVAAQGRPDGHRPRVRAVALNTSLLGVEAAGRAVAEVERISGLPCADPVRQGGDGLLTAVLDAR